MAKKQKTATKPRKTSKKRASSSKEETSTPKPKHTRSLQDAATAQRQKAENGDTVKWLAEQAAALEENSDTLPLGKEEMWQEFDRILAKNLMGTESLNAMFAHGAIENLEIMYTNAQLELLKAKRKTMVLEKVVTKAHSLLEEQALSFFEK